MRAECPSLSAARVTGSIRGGPLIRRLRIRAIATRGAVLIRFSQRGRFAPDTLLPVALMEVRIIPVRDAEVTEVRFEGSAKPMDGTAC